MWKSLKDRAEGVKEMKRMKTTEAVGQVLCHDITQIIPGVTKDAVFRKGHIIREEDIPVLLSVGKDSVYIWENDETMMHENDAAEVLYRMTANEHMHPSDVKEGTIATRHGNTVVKKGDKLAGTRIIPLVIKKDKMQEAEKICDGTPILKILPFTVKKAAIITTGNEVYHGRIKDAFTPVIEQKIAEFGAEMMFHEIFDDNDRKITDGCLRAIEAGADIVFCTGGMSVDPDDKTPLAIKNTGAEMISYGSPVLPGAMFLLSYYRKGDKVIPICGLPGCAMYNRRTIFDLVLPRLMAADPVTADELASLGEGGLCLNCKVCTFPNCGFGKGW